MKEEDATENVEIEAQQFKVPEAKTVDEIMNTDIDDPSLTKYKMSILGDPSKCKGGLAITFLRMEMVVENDPPLVYKIDRQITSETGEIEIKLQEEHQIKEGRKYVSYFVFKVDRDIVNGLKCVHKIMRSIMTMDEIDVMIGSYGAKDTEIKAVLLSDKTPSGLVAHGKYKIISRFTDDDKILNVKVISKLKITG